MQGVIVEMLNNTSISPLRTDLFERNKMMTTTEALLLIINETLVKPTEDGGSALSSVASVATSSSVA